jgi:hypothetical protein
MAYPLALLDFVRVRTPKAVAYSPIVNYVETSVILFSIPPAPSNVFDSQ